MTKTERMKLAIQQRQVAAKIEAAPVQAALPPPEQPKPAPPAEKPRKGKRPKADRYETQPERFDTALQLHDRGRLPAGAIFSVDWDGDEWKGELRLADGESFVLTGRKLFRLLADIDTLYRAWKAKSGEVPT